MKNPAPALTAEKSIPFTDALLFELKNFEGLDKLQDHQLANLWILALHDPHPCSPALAHAIGAHLEPETLHLDAGVNLTIMPHSVTFVDEQHNDWQLCRLDPASTDLHFLCNDFLIQVFHFNRVLDYTPRPARPKTTLPS